tara:strand:+ start:117 stop:353 length:237 start_codon:yes stop_codon:yes gene_type:complete
MSSNKFILGEICLLINSISLGLNSTTPELLLPLKHKTTEASFGFKKSSLNLTSLIYPEVSNLTTPSLFFFFVFICIKK